MLKFLHFDIGTLMHFHSNIYTAHRMYLSAREDWGVKGLKGVGEDK